jgi:hypothetical protein
MWTIIEKLQMRSTALLVGGALNGVLKDGCGQYMAPMVAAKKLTEIKGRKIKNIY